MGDRIAVTMSMIPPGMVGDCTVCLRHADKVWWKTYRSEREGWHEATDLGLVAHQLGPSEDGERYIGTLRTSFLPEAFVDPKELEVRGFHLRTTKSE